MLTGFRVLWRARKTSIIGQKKNRHHTNFRWRLYGWHRRYAAGARACRTFLTRWPAHAGGQRERRRHRSFVAQLRRTSRHSPQFLELEEKPEWGSKTGASNNPHCSCWRGPYSRTIVSKHPRPALSPHRHLPSTASIPCKTTAGEGLETTPSIASFVMRYPRRWALAWSPQW